MGVPRRRHSPARRDRRRAHHKGTAPTLVACSNCGEMTKPHHVCPKCGHYGGRAIRVTVTE